MHYVLNGCIVHLATSIYYMEVTLSRLLGNVLHLVLCSNQSLVF